MASTAHIAGAFAFASMSFGITFERSKPVVIERNRRIDCGEPRRILSASFYIELVVDPFRSEIALFIGDPIVEPAMRLNHEFRHIAVSPLIISIAMLDIILPVCKCLTVMPWAPTTGLQNSMRQSNGSASPTIVETRDHLWFACQPFIHTHEPGRSP